MTNPRNKITEIHRCGDVILRWEMINSSYKTSELFADFERFRFAHVKVRTATEDTTHHKFIKKKV